MGYGTEQLSIYDDIAEEDYRLWEVRPQLIYHLKRGTRIKAFFSLELFYISHRETRINSEFDPESELSALDITSDTDTDIIAFEQADYRRIKYGFTINYGDYIRFSDRIGLRSSVGIGMRIKDNSYANIVNPQAGERDGFIPFGTPYYFNEGISVGAEVHLSFRLYFTARKKSKS